MLKIAITKGRIEKDFCDMLQKSGYNVEPLINKERKLIIDTEDNIEYIFVKGTDIITYLNYGAVDVGVIGKDTLIESDKSKYMEIADLNIGKCKFCLASSPEYKNKIFNRNKIIATKYPSIAKKYFDDKNEKIDIIKLNGSIEVAPILKMTDAIVDIVETGDTLKANGLEVVDEICDVSTRLITNKEVFNNKDKKSELYNFVKKLKIEA